MGAPKNRYCPRCGERLSPEAESCPMCALPVPPRKVRRRRVTLFVKLLIPAAVLLTVAAAVLLPRLLLTDAQRFVKLQKDLLLEPVLSALRASGPKKGAGTALTLTAESADPILGDYLRGTCAELAFSSGEGELAVRAEVTLMASPILSAGVTRDGPVFGVWASPLADRYYTADLPKLLGRFGVELPDRPETPAPDGRLAARLLERYFDLAASLVREDNLTVEKDARIRFVSTGETADVTLYTFTPSAGAARELLRLLADAVEEDEDLLEVFAYYQELRGSGAAERAARRDLLALSDLLYELSGAPFPEGEALRWTLASAAGLPRQIVVSRGAFALTLELTFRDGEPTFYLGAEPWDVSLELSPAPAENGGVELRFTLSAPEARVLEDTVFTLRVRSCGLVSPPELEREDITDYSVIRLLALAREIGESAEEGLREILGGIPDILYEGR